MVLFVLNMFFTMGILASFQAVLTLARYCWYGADSWYGGRCERVDL